ncbi:MAG: serine acetyltransferase, partial [Bacteroidetes bacterium]|nr:serine acetyltransferase [Bacteroidota bacterium]
MITDKKTYKSYWLADRLANSSPIKVSIINKFRKLLFPDYIIQFLYLLRKTEYSKNCKNGVFGKLSYFYFLRRFRKLSVKLSFSIPINVFGPGLSIPHYGTIIVNPASKVGKNCRLHACVNIGASGGSSISPILGDNIYIGPGAIIFGDIVVADNVTIAANSTINKSIRVPNITVGGT